MGTISLRFYTVTMPDGRRYCAQGQSIKKVAARLKIPVSQVQIGADLLRTPSVAEYFVTINGYLYAFVWLRDTQHLARPGADTTLCGLRTDDFSRQPTMMDDCQNCLRIAATHALP